MKILFMKLRWARMDVFKAIPQENSAFGLKNWVSKEGIQNYKYKSIKNAHNKKFAKAIRSVNFKLSFWSQIFQKTNEIFSMISALACKNSGTL